MKFFVLALCAWFIALLAYCIAHRILYPFELEWLEGDMLLTAVRLLEHQSIYAPPGTDYVPGIYPPFYYVVVAAAFWLFEPGLPLLRGVSVLSLLFIFALIYRIVHREAQRHWLALLGVGLFASFYNHHASWYDIGRVDSLFFCLLLLGLWLASRARRGTAAAIAASLVLCLALFTKQSTVIYIPFVLLFLFLKNRRASIVFGATFFLLSVTLFLVLQASSDGWFATYTIVNPLGFPKIQSTPSVLRGLTASSPIMLIMLAAGVCATFMRIRLRREISLWEITLLPSLIAYLHIRPIVGAYANDSIYLTLWLSILIPIWLQTVSAEMRHPLYRTAVNVLACALLSIQLIGSRYTPGKWLPVPGSAAKGQELLARLNRAEGPVLVHQHPLYAWLSGKDPSMTPCNLWAYNLGKQHYVPEDLFAKIRNGYFSVIVLDDSSAVFGADLAAQVHNNYQLERTISYQSPLESFPSVGYRSRPQTIWVPK